MHHALTTVVAMVVESLHANVTPGGEWLLREMMVPCKRANGYIHASLILVIMVQLATTTVREAAATQGLRFTVIRE